jgi:uncharacterized protein (UPF0335 family)
LGLLTEQKLFSNENCFLVAVLVGGCPLRVRLRLGKTGAQAYPPRHTPGKGPFMSDVTADAYNVTAEELRQFVERFEHLEAEKADIADQQKEVMAEAKGRGYDTKVLRKIIALRKRKPDDIAEEEAVLELYKSALGMV